MITRLALIVAFFGVLVVGLSSQVNMSQPGAYPIVTFAAVVFLVVVVFGGAVAHEYKHGPTPSQRESDAIMDMMMANLQPRGWTTYRDWDQWIQSAGREGTMWKYREGWNMERITRELNRMYYPGIEYDRQRGGHLKRGWRR